jgi:hypothetical protein
MAMARVEVLGGGSFDLDICSGKDKAIDAQHMGGIFSGNRY